ncbi:hypothetical protein EVAR_94553_1 [Eumeta japonica]|uniref:Uncharacterized protein n=1 Tax=Eumeta variegata TaxID=151549 RepID=A0A4C1UWT2_EUMVA|nr:hypothetical protein EVAR_94553_1 [Eumeta japonica]
MNAQPPAARGVGVVVAVARGLAHALLRAAAPAPARRRYADAPDAEAGAASKQIVGVEDRSKRRCVPGEACPAAGCAPHLRLKYEAALMVFAQGSGEERVRVRRARLQDGPRALHLVRHQLRGAPLPPAALLLVADLVAQTLAQGHSLVAEAGAGEMLCGLALCASLRPWDAAQLERRARCVRCARSRRLVQLAAHCLRAPALHHKYSVDAIFQVQRVAFYITV